MSRQLLVGVLVFLVVGLIIGPIGLASVNGVYEGYPIVRLKVNGARIDSDVPGILFNGRTLVPLRFVSEALGAKVEWDGETMTASVFSSTTGASEQNPYRSTPGKGIWVNLTTDQINDAIMFGTANQQKDFSDLFEEYFKTRSGDSGWAQAFLRTEWVHDAWSVWRAAGENEEPLSAEVLESWYPEDAIYVELQVSVDSPGQADKYKAYAKQYTRIWPLELNQDWQYKKAPNGSYYGWTYFRIPLAGLDLSAPIEVKLVKTNSYEYSFSWNLFELK